MLRPMLLVVIATICYVSPYRRCMFCGMQIMFNARILVIKYFERCERRSLRHRIYLWLQRNWYTSWEPHDFEWRPCTVTSYTQHLFMTYGMSSMFSVLSWHSATPRSAVVHVGSHNLKDVSRYVAACELCECFLLIGFGVTLIISQWSWRL